MEKKTIQVPKYKQIKVKDGFTEEEVFVAEDGTQFSSAKICQKYEDQLHLDQMYANIKKIPADYDLPDLGTIGWYFCTTQEEIDLVYKTHDHYVVWNNHERMQPNRWFGVRYEDGGDHRGDIYVYDLETIQKEVEEFFRKFKG